MNIYMHFGCFLLVLLLPLEADSTSSFVIFANAVVCLFQLVIWSATIGTLVQTVTKSQEF